MLRMLGFGLVMAACLTSQGVAGDEAQTGIIGGKETETAKWPWMAAVNFVSSAQDTHSSLICGGTLIAPRWVLTAAHCVTSLGDIRLHAGNLRVIVGSAHRSGQGGEVINVSHIYIHPEYRRETLHHDVALLRLDARSSVAPVRLANASQRAYLEEAPRRGLLTAMGWGRSRASDPASGATWLRETRLDYVPDNVCARVWQNLSGGQICAGGRVAVQDTCTGDSGGPLLMHYQGRHWLVGVTSYGAAECGTRGVPGVYTSAADYAGWMQRTVYTNLVQLAREGDGEGGMSAMHAVHARASLTQHNVAMQAAAQGGAEWLSN